MPKNGINLKIMYKKYNKIFQCSKDGKLVKVWNGRKELMTSSFKMKAIYDCINGINKSGNGFVWTITPQKVSYRRDDFIFKSVYEGESVMPIQNRNEIQKFKIKLSKEHFSGNMTPEQIEDIARDLGFYDSGNIKPLENKE